MIFSLKRVQYNARMSEETLAFSADVYIDGKKAGYATNSGTGGSTSVNLHLLSPEKRKEVFEWEKQQPPHTFPASAGMDSFTMPTTIDLIVDNLFNEWYDAKYGEVAQHKKWIKNAIAFRLPTEPKGVYRTIKFNKGFGYSKKLRDHVIKTYGSDVEILNDKYGQVAV